MIKCISTILLLTALTADAALAWTFDDEVKTRIEALDLFVTPKFNNRVKKELHVYFNLDNSKTELILERMVQHFPLIENQLRLNGMPADLKYMVLAESQIDPLAVSGDDAAGLWQLMPNTARELGLRVDDDIDERRDPMKSTQAAITYLQQLHFKLNDWCLVVAAYNGGYVRIKRAMKKAGSEHFDKIKKYLPKETREFKDRIVAAAYLCQYYNYHFFVTPEINLDLQVTESIKVNTHTRLVDVAKRTGLPPYIVCELNPMYKKKYIPASARGRSLILPARVVDRYKNKSLASHGGLDKMFYNPNGQYIKHTYQAQKNEDIYSIAKAMNTDPYLLKYWNKIETLVVRRDRELYFYQFRS